MGNRPRMARAERGDASRPTVAATRDPFVAIALVAAAALAVQLAVNVVASPAAGAMLVDDAYFFVRYAHHWRDHGVLAWNVGGPATHGITSLLHQLVVTAIVARTGHDDVLALQLASNVAFALAAAALACLASVSVASEGNGGEGNGDRGLRRAAVALTLTTLATTPVLTLHARSGMDTGLATFVATASLLLAIAVERTPNGALARSIVAWLPALAVVTHLARPDLDLLCAGPFVALAIAGNERRLRLALGGAALALVATLVVLRLRLGTALPLAAYVKHSALWASDPGHAATYRFEGVRELGVFATATLPWLGVWALAGAPMPKLRALRGAICAAAAFVAYHALLTVPIMTFAARFYVPALPAVVALAAVGVPRLALRERTAMFAWLALLVAGRGLVARDYVRAIIVEARALPASAHTPAGALEYVASRNVVWAGLSLLARDLDAACRIAAFDD
ncbi:MAG: hypothetical protein ACHREM_25945, partial [Polyangiales bacterium]